MAWRHGGSDPFRMYHGLDENYRPIGSPDEPASLPAYPNRVKNFVYGAGLYAEEMDTERVKAMAGVASSRRAAV